MQVYTHVYNQYLVVPEEHFDSELKECPSFVGK